MITLYCLIGMDDNDCVVCCLLYISAFIEIKNIEKRYEQAQLVLWLRKGVLLR